MKDTDAQVRKDAALDLWVGLYSVGGKAERAASAELDREGQAEEEEAARQAAKANAKRYSMEDIVGPLEFMSEDQKYQGQLKQMVSLGHNLTPEPEAQFLVTIYQATLNGLGGFRPEYLAIWKRTGDNQYKQIYTDGPDVTFDQVYRQPILFKSRAVVTGEGATHYESDQFVAVTWNWSGWGQGDIVFALDPKNFGEVKIESPEDWYRRKLRPGENTPDAVENSLTDDSLKFDFGIHGPEDQGWHMTSAGQVTGTYKIIKQMSYDAKAKAWIANWKMLVASAKREPIAK
ncbi:MAG: hypothetical protein ACREQI_09165 [Candidatus Binataceae bacterium]